MPCHAPRIGDGPGVLGRVCWGEDGNFLLGTGLSRLGSVGKASLKSAFVFSNLHSVHNLEFLLICMQHCV